MLPWRIVGIFKTGHMFLPVPVLSTLASKFYIQFYIKLLLFFLPLLLLLWQLWHLTLGSCNWATC